MQDFTSNIKGIDSSAGMETNMETLPFLLNKLPKFALKKCEEELNETPERKRNSIQELRNLLSSNPTTSGIIFHDDVLLQYLRRDKYQISRCFKEIKNFVNLKRKERLTFERLPDKYLSLSSLTEIITVLPKRCPKGCAIVYTQVGQWDPNKLPFLHFKQLLLTVCMQLLRDPMAQIAGFKSIHDVQGLSTSHLRYATPKNMCMLYDALMKCFPGRFTDIHIINHSFPMKVVWNVIKPFLSEKMRSRIYFHNSPEELLDIFPSSLIPTKYGGNLQEKFDMREFLRSACKDRYKYTIEARPNLY